MAEIVKTLDTQEKLRILADAAKYDVACTSSGVDRKGQQGMLGNSAACGICHSFGADGRCISLLKVLMTNHCVFDCKYCLNRRSNDIPRATFEPDELCKLTIEFYKRNYIEGLFLSSGVIKNPTYTMEQMCETLFLLRNKYKFNGYIHVKTIPGAPDELLTIAGYLADRISVNLELPTDESLHKLAPNKTFRNILNPMGKITDTIAAHRLAIGKDARMERSQINNYLTNSIFNQQDAIDTSKADDKFVLNGNRVNLVNGNEQNTIKKNSYTKIINEAHSSIVENSLVNEENSGMFYNSSKNNLDNNYKEAEVYNTVRLDNKPEKQNSHNSILYNSDRTNYNINNEFYTPSFSDNKLALVNDSKYKRPFAPAGQSTQMIIGATEETDLTLIRTTQALYQSYDLKRVFFSAYIPLNEDENLPALGTPTPMLREHRLYQADFLLRYYGFRADELLSDDRPNFNERIDPKCDWAVRHLDLFPVELQKAPYDLLMRVPGIGPKSAKRIVSARRYGSLTFESLKRMGVVLKRAHYFILCNGKMMFNTPIDEQYIAGQLADMNTKENWQIKHQNENYSQMTLSDFGVC